MLHLMFVYYVISFSLRLGATMPGAVYVFTTCLLVTLYFTPRSFASLFISEVSKWH